MKKQKTLLKKLLVKKDLKRVGEVDVGVDINTIK